MVRQIEDLEPTDEGGGTYYPPEFQSGDWARINDLVAGRTDYRSVNFAAQEGDAIDLNGVYAATGVTATTVVLASPESVNPAWTDLVTATNYASPTLATQGEAWVGPFVLDQPGVTDIVANFTAPQGMYLVTGKGKDRPMAVTVRLEVTPVDPDNVATGPSVTFDATISGDGKDKAPKGQTLEAPVSVSGRCRIRARRITDKDYDSEDTIVDEVRWRDGFGTALVTQDHFGNLTTMHTRTYATSGATSTKERKLNCRATRLVPERNLDDTFGPGLVASRSVADIICAMALDPIIGGRSLAELDVPQIYDTVDEAATYFGFVEATYFGYTFDQENVSFEEMVQTVAQVAFSTAYRQGNVLRLFLEKETEDATLLFNHRNKVPGSERRTVRFGYLNDHDGVELDYIDALDGTTRTIYIPEDRSAVKAKKIELVGSQSSRQALIHANRAWNKIRYQHTATEFSALGEASQLVLNERIEVTDNTRPDVFDGHVVSQVGLILELSQPFVETPGTDYTIFLQNPDGGLETIAVVAGADDRHVVLQAPPSFAIITDPDVWADTLYQIVGAEDTRTSAFLLTEKGAYDKRQVGVQAINYDLRYYQNDRDFAAPSLAFDLPRNSGYIIFLEDI